MTIHASMRAAGSTPLPLRINDLVRSDDYEPRIPDLTLADRLGFTKPHNVRKLILRNRMELEAHGDLPTRGNNLRHGEKGRGRPGTMYLLNEGQALVVCALSRTPIAARVRQDIIAVYMAHRRGEGVTTRPERQALRFIAEHAHVHPSGEVIDLGEGYVIRAAGSVLVSPVTESVLSALATFEAHDGGEPDEDGEPSLGALGTFNASSEWYGDTSDREFDLDSDEGDVGYGTVDDEHTLGWNGHEDQTELGRGEPDAEPSLGWTDRTSQLRLGEGHEDGDNTAHESEGAGFFHCALDDHEPSLASIDHEYQPLWSSGTNDDREQDVGDEGEIDADNEPTLGWTNPSAGPTSHPGGQWGCTEDGEGEGPDENREPSLGAIEGLDGSQVDWGRSSASDREHDFAEHEADEPEGDGDFAGGGVIGADEIAPGAAHFGAKA